MPYYLEGDYRKVEMKGQRGKSGNLLPNICKCYDLKTLQYGLLHGKKL